MLLCCQVFFILASEFDAIADARSCQKAVLQISLLLQLVSLFVAISIQNMHCHLIKIYVF